ncbi:MAG: glutathione S-transferase family protein [Rhodospirillaceae bacterium]|nr:glutathione S-transferase family protein [Rhodospirillaceae bacterium]
MILVGQYDSPYVRRVAVSLRLLSFDYTHDTRSVFGDFDDMRRTNPLGRIPSLILDDGEVLIDSGAILDWLDETVGPARALIPTSGLARRRCLQLLALSCGASDKAGASNYERLIRPQQYRWPEWIARLRIQAKGAIAALAAVDWPDISGGARLTQAEITTACLWRYLEMTDPELLLDPQSGERYRHLVALSAQCERLPAFAATYPPDVVYPLSD